MADKKILNRSDILFNLRLVLKAGRIFLKSLIQYVRKISKKIFYEIRVP